MAFNDGQTVRLDDESGRRLGEVYWCDWDAYLEAQRDNQMRRVVRAIQSATAEGY